jgi:hypothetical protein
VGGLETGQECAGGGPEGVDGTAEARASGCTAQKTCPWSGAGRVELSRCTCVVLVAAGTAGKEGQAGDRGVTGCQGELQADGQWVRFIAELTPGRAGGGEHKIARRCRDGVTLC